MYDIFDEEYIQRIWEKETRKESREEGREEALMEGIDAMIANLRKIGINEDAIQNAAEMSRKQLKLS